MATRISELIQTMVKEHNLTVREPHPMSWGDRDQCKRLFIEIFREVDTTYNNYRHLPEYERVIDWMTDTKDVGLLLMGDCGRGKSIILSGVLPVLFRMKNRIIRPVHAQDMYKEIPNQNYVGYGQRPETNLDFLLRTHFPVIDELGIEGLQNDYGEKCEGFNLVMNAAERYHRPLFITTNLTEEQIFNRYGERTLDRLGYLCRVIRFEGRSLRNK